MLFRAALTPFVAFAALLPATAARAEIALEVELVAGAGRNLGGLEAHEYFDRNAVLGLRGIAYLEPAEASRFRLAAELAVDVMHYEWVEESEPDATPSDPDALRERFLVGTRLEWRVSPRFQVFGRALVGVDHYATDELHFQVPEGVVVAPLLASGSALAAELGAGARVTIGHLVLGLQCGVPVAFYATERPVASSSGPGEGFVVPRTPDHWLRGTVVDVEGMATVGVAF